MTLLSQAVAQHRAGDLAKARALGEKALAGKPRDIGALHLLAVLDLQQGNPGSALERLQRAVAIDNSVFDLHLALGNAAINLNKFDIAETAFRRALALQPSRTDLLLQIAILLTKQEKNEAAIGQFQEYLAIDPENADAAAYLGVVLRRTERYDEAIAQYHRAIELQPDHRDAHFNLGNLLYTLKRNQEAVLCYQTATRIFPDRTDILSHLGSVLNRLDRLEESEAAYRRGVELAPDSPELRDRLGLLLQKRGAIEEAQQQYDLAIELAPKDARIRYNRALLLLLRGRIEEGWSEHEWRWHASELPLDKREFPRPVWDGAPFEGTLLLHGEQGLGDMIQFLRYAEPARRRVKRLVVGLPRSLMKLAEGVPGIDELIAEGGVLPPFDRHLQMLSLPLVLGEASGAPVPYLPVAPAATDSWHALFREQIGSPESRVPARPLVGLVWAGNPKHANDRNRSIALPALASLLAQEQIRFVSLQLGGGDQLRAAGLESRVADLSPHLHDFADTAAAISALDLVIAVDTSVAHVAAAAGKEVWLLLPFAPDWRWGTAGTDTRWYPRMRLFRQQHPGDWTPVIAEMERQLVWRYRRS